MEKTVVKITTYTSLMKHMYHIANHFMVLFPCCMRKQININYNNTHAKITLLNVVSTPPFRFSSDIDRLHVTSL